MGSVVHQFFKWVMVPFFEKEGLFSFFSDIPQRGDHGKQEVKPRNTGVEQVCAYFSKLEGKLKNELED